MTTKNFVVKNGITTGNIVLDAATGNITSTNANLGNLVTANFTTAVLTTGAQPNITSTGTLTDLSVTANANIGNIGTGGRDGKGQQVTAIGQGHCQGAVHHGLFEIYTCDSACQVKKLPVQIVKCRNDSTF